MKAFFSNFLEKYNTTKELWSLTLLILLSILFYLINPAFLSAMNISNFFAYFPELGIMALSMTYLLIAGEFDLSIGAVFAFGPVIMYALRNNAGVPIELAWVIAIVLAAFLGFLNGILVTKVRISSFLATLGMMLIVRGIALFVANAFPQSQWSTASPLKAILSGSYRIGEFTIFNSFIWFVAIFIVMLYILRMTRFGNWMYATGGSMKSARESRGITPTGSRSSSSPCRPFPRPCRERSTPSASSPPTRIAGTGYSWRPSPWWSSAAPPCTAAAGRSSGPCSAPSSCAQ